MHFSSLETAKEVAVKGLFSTFSRYGGRKLIIMSFHEIFYITEGYREGYPYDVTVSRLENEGFGFVIISSVSRAGSTIGRIIPGTVATNVANPDPDSATKIRGKHIEIGSISYI